MNTDANYESVATFNLGPQGYLTALIDKNMYVDAAAAELCELARLLQGNVTRSRLRIGDVFASVEAYDAAALADPRKDELLREAADKPVKRVLQIDGFTDTWGDIIHGDDDDGDAVMCGSSYELSRCLSRDMPVRVFVHEHGDPEAVSRLLKKIADWTPEEIANLMPAAVDAREADCPF